jgi:hypothetical protein
LTSNANHSTGYNPCALELKKFRHLNFFLTFKAIAPVEVVSKAGVMRSCNAVEKPDIKMNRKVSA